MIKFIISAIILGMASPLPAHIVRPIEYGDWQVWCYLDKTCEIQRRDWPELPYLNQVMVNISPAKGRGGILMVTSTSWNKDTCLRVELSEEVPIDMPSDHDAWRYHRAAGALDSRILAVLKSHFSMFAICNAMGGRVSPAPSEQLEASLPDFQRALHDQRWIAVLEAARALP